MDGSSPDTGLTQPDSPVGPNRFRPRAQLVSHLPYMPPGAATHPKAFYTVAEVALMLDLTVQTVKAMLRDGRLGCLRIQGPKRHRVRIPVGEVAKLFLAPLKRKAV